MRWRQPDRSDALGFLAIGIGYIGFPLLTYLFLPLEQLITQAPMLFWAAMFTPFGVWLLFQAALSVYAALFIRPVPRRDWPRTLIAGVVILTTGFLSVGPWLAFLTFGFLYGADGPVF